MKLYYLREVYDTCPKACTVFEYHGEHETSNDQGINIRTIGFDYWMGSSEIKLQTEYLVYDLNGLVGFVGGTLGLFLGFSFFEVIKIILGMLKSVIITYWPRNRKLSSVWSGNFGIKPQMSTNSEKRRLQKRDLFFDYKDIDIFHESNIPGSVQFSTRKYPNQYR